MRNLIKMSLAVVALLGFSHTAYAVQITVPSAPTSNYALISSTTGNYQVKAVPTCSTASSALTFNVSTSAFGCNSISGGSSAFPFTPQSWGNATSTTLGFLNGFLSTASSTQNAAFYLTTTPNALLASGLDGLVYATATNTISTSGGITTTNGSYVVGSGLTIGCTTATGSVPGCLSAADWTTFNSKNGWAYPWMPVAGGNATSSPLYLYGGLYTIGSTTVQYASTTAITAQSANIARLDNFTQAGFLKTNSIGTLSIDTSAYITLASLSGTSPISYNSGTGAFSCPTCVTSVSSTWPIISSGGTTPGISWGGIGTSTNLTAGELIYATGANTIGQVATTTLSGSGVISVTASAVVIGPSPITVSCATCGTVSSVALSLPSFFTITGSPVTGSGTLTGSITQPSNAIVGINAAGNDLVATGTVNNLTVPGINATSTTASKFLYASTTAFTVSGNLNIPSGSAPLLQTAGDVAVDTTAGQFKYYDGVGTNILSATTSKAFNLASTTLDAMGHSFNTSTSTFLLANLPEPMTLVGFYCTASTTGTALVRFGDGVNWTEEYSCSSGGFQKTNTNNTFTAFEPFNVQASSTAGQVSRITATAVLKFTSQ